MSHSRSGLSREDRENILAYLLIGIPVAVITYYIFRSLYEKYFIQKKMTSKIPTASVLKAINKDKAQKSIAKKSGRDRIQMRNTEDQSQTDLSSSYESSYNKSEDTKDNDKIKRVREDTKKKKTSEIQLLIDERKKSKLFKKSQEATLAAEKSEESKKQKQIRSELLAQKKSNQEKISYKKEKSFSTAVSSSSDTLSNQSSSMVRAKKNLVKHSEYLLKFLYHHPEDNPEARKNNLIKTLAFLYNFHRYNLCRRVLYSFIQTEKDSEDKEQAVKLRTQIVHGANKILLDHNLIIDTQKKLSEWVSNEVADLRQKGSHIWIKSDQTQQNLFSLSKTNANQITFESMQTLPLYMELYQVNIDSNSPDNISDKNFYLWMKYAVIPFLNLFDSSRSILGYEDRDAIKMMIIIFGEYCSTQRNNSINDNFSIWESDNNINKDDVYIFINNCKEIRNSLSHNVFDVSNDEIDELLTMAKKINNDLLINDAFETVLTPESLSVSSPTLK